MRIPGVTVVAVLLLSLPTLGVAQEFSLEARQVESESIVGGAIPIEVTVTYVGKEPVKWENFDLRSNSLSRSFMLGAFGKVEGWQDRWENKMIDDSLSRAMPGSRMLNPGNSMRARLYLQDYFSQMTPGKHELVIFYRTKNTRISRSFTVNLVPFSQEVFTRFVEAVLKKIENKTLPQEERQDALRETLYLLHPNLSKVYLAVLKDKSDFWDKPSAYRAFARNAMKFEECLKELVKFLSTVEDGKDSAVAFEELRDGKVTLTKEQVDTLLSSKSANVRKFTTNFLGCLANVTPANEFELEIRQDETESMAGGSIPIEVTVTNLGKEPVEVYKFIMEAWRGLRSLEFHAPAEWTDRYPNKALDLDPTVPGFVVTQVLQPGETFSLRVYLQDYFSKVTAGEHQLLANFSIGIVGKKNREVAEKRIKIEKSFTVKLAPFDEQKFSKFLVDTIKLSQDKEVPLIDQAEALRAMYYLSHPRMWEVYLAVIEHYYNPWNKAEIRGNTYAAFARNAVEYKTCRQKLIEYLSSVESPDTPSFIFSVWQCAWQKSRFQLSTEEIEKLLQSKSSEVQEAAKVYLHWLKEQTKKEQEKQKEPEKQSSEGR